MSECLDNRLADSQQRKDALDPRRSFICEAPAGSGKTELLTQRFLTLLATVNLPEEILAMTFTRKASGEMRGRVISALQNAKQNPKPESEHARLTWGLATNALVQDKKLEWNLIDSPGRLQIKTFDSLCSSLANTLPLHSSFATPPQVSDDPGELYLAAARKFMATLEDDAAWSDSIAQILTLLDNNTQKLEALLIRMLAQREAWLPLLGSGSDVNSVLEALEDNLQSVRFETVEQLLSCIPHEYHQRLCEHGAFAASNLHNIQTESPTLCCLNLGMESGELPDASEEGVEQWLGLIHILLTGTGGWRKTVDKRCGFPAGEGAVEKKSFKEKKQAGIALIKTLSDVAGLHSLLLDMRNLPSMHYADEQRELLVAVVHVLPVLSAYLSVTFQEKNAVDFSEISLKARIALGKLDDPSDLALALDYRMQHILVDEFQDTSPAQIELLQSLTGGWEIDDGRTMFCVGDAMQSIYGFRGANVGLFLRCIDQGLGGVALTPLRLNTNFRSEANLVEWINQVFGASFPQVNDISVGAVTYSSSVAFNQSSIDDGIAVHGFADGTSQEDEAAKVVELVQRAQSEDPDGSIGILVRNRNHIAHITPALDAAGLTYRAVDLEPLAGHIVIQDLMALTHALLRPANRIAWLSVLRAPWCGLTLVDLEAVATAQNEGEEKHPLTVHQQISRVLHSESYAKDSANHEVVQGDMFAPSSVADESVEGALTSDGRSRLLRVSEILQRGLEQSHRKSLRQWIEGVWLALGGPSCLSTPQEKNNATLFFSLLEKLDVDRVLARQDALDKAVQKLFLLPDPDSDDRLQIMTIHKSKGLEFDSVIVPSLQRSPRSNDPELLRWYERLSDDGETSLLLSTITSSGKDKDPVETHLAWQAKRRESNETCRLLYVACTRARKRLHLMAHLNSDKKDASVVKPPSQSSLLWPIWKAVEPGVRVLQRTEAPASESVSAEGLPIFQCLPMSWQCPELHTGALLESYIPYFSHSNAQPVSIEWADATARIVGTFVHRLFKSLTISQLQGWIDGGLESEAASWGRILASMGVARGKLAQAVDQSQAVMQGVCNDTDRHWMFADTHPKRCAEFAMTVSSSVSSSLSPFSGERQLIVDLLLYDGSTTWIIDYKTSQPSPDQSTETFIQAELEVYRDVMFRYKSTVDKLGYNNIKLALYFPMIGSWIEYD